MATPFERRVTTVQASLNAVEGDAVVLSPSPNLTYLTGFEESPSERLFVLVVPRRGDPTFVVPTMYEEQLPARYDSRLWDDADDPLEVLAACLRDHGVVSSVGVDDGTSSSDDGSTASTGGQSIDADGDVPRLLLDDSMWATFVLDVQSLVPSGDFGLASAVLEPARIRKDDLELETLRRAGALADRVSLEIRERSEEFVGASEADLAAEIDRLLVEYGGRAPSFTTIVASGPNGARPHHHSGNRLIEAGDPVVLDFGAFVEADLEEGSAAYPGDQTRTLVLEGDPPESYREIHEVVQEAQEAAVEAVEPGVTAGEIDRTARSIIEEAGYGNAFLHRTGHGVGLEVHEPPYIVDGNDRELEPGMVFSVEPGIYLDGEFGVRIEDLVVVTDDGYERLNDTPRGWDCREW